MRYDTRTFQINFETGKFYGYCDALASVKQAVKLMLAVPRFEHEIFSRNFGHDLQTLIGKSADYVMGDLRRMIREALMSDERILDVDHFLIEKQEEVMKVKFTVSTIYGDYIEERSVNWLG